MQQLNLPPAQLTIEGDKVFDPLRGRFVALTPEEWVRQHFVAWLADGCGYPPHLTANEVALSLNGTSRRCDTVVYDRWGCPWMIVEYKAPHVNVDRRVFAQILRYNLVLGAPYLAVSNGLVTYCCAIDYPAGTPRFLTSFPPYPAP